LPLSDFINLLVILFDSIHAAVQSNFCRQASVDTGQGSQLLTRKYVHIVNDAARPEVFVLCVVLYLVLCVCLFLF